MMKNLAILFIISCCCTFCYSQEIYKTSNTAGNYINTWTKIVTVQLVNRYNFSNVNLRFQGGNAGVQNISVGDISFRVKQQAALGDAPVIQLELNTNYSSRLDKSDIKAIIVENSSVLTKVELYLRIPVSWDDLVYTPLLVNGIAPEFHSQDGFKSHLPSGQVVDCIFPNAYKERMGIGTSDLGGNQLAVEGTIGAREVKVSTENWADFVFEDQYSLPDLLDVEAYIDANKHLEGIPTEKQVTESGINLKEINIKLLEKVEQLMLYTIQQEKSIRALQKDNSLIKENYRALLDSISKAN
ncbi:hypothetical protein [Zunongwangia pacifica]|uniref:Uncharacterized protein n=1 Tax=Zunongwangia pacifica TaxID=2911062 RepID=A0A9X2A566_9FLAO|nr:hypothetical protein [Zunongwangia pacifica]MCL6220759.1 hypothetical protein [Zunongwangia pacifica]